MNALSIWRSAYNAAAGVVKVQSGAYRTTGTLHRSAIAAVDKLAIPAAPTLADVAVGGLLLNNTSYNVAVAAVSLQPGSGAILGVTPFSPVVAQATALDGNDTHCIRTAITQVVSAGAYLISCSVDAAPKLVGYVTEAERAAGGVLTAFGTVGAGSVAGSIDVALAGTGIQTSHAAFAVNTAHLPGAPTLVNCAGYARALITLRARLSKTAVWATTPALSVIPWLKDQEGSADWGSGTVITPSLLVAATDTLTQCYTLEVDGAVGLAVTVAVLTGLASVDVYVELV